MENCPYILVGISPVFEDYKVIINAYQNRFTLEPELKPEYIEKAQKIMKKQPIKIGNVKDFKKRYGYQ